MFIRTHRKLLTGVAFLSFMTAHSSATFSQRTRSSLPANPEQIVPSSVLAQIKQQAATTYPTDFVMQEYKIEQQTSAYITVQSFELSEIPNDIIDQIKASARSRYPSDYEMQQYKIEQQSDAYLTIKSYSNPQVPTSVLSKIMADAKVRYPSDYEMQEYRITQQAEAYLRLK